MSGPQWSPSAAAVSSPATLGTTTSRSTTATRSVPGAPVTGPALVQSRFTTIVLAAGDEARMLPNGDVLIEVAPA